MNVKRSKLQRKYVRAMDQLADVPRPARRFKYPPTLAAPVTQRQCTNLVDIKWKRRGLLRVTKQAKAKLVVCGVPLVAVPFKGRLECPSCRIRSKHDRRAVRQHTEAVMKRAVGREPWTLAKAARGKFFSRRKP